MAEFGAGQPFFNDSCNLTFSAQKRARESVILRADGDKEHRTRVHRAIVKAFNLLETKTVNNSRYILGRRGLCSLLHVVHLSILQ